MALEFTISHVFFPPQLPQEDDNNLEHEIYMIQTFCNSVTGFIKTQPCSSLRRARDMLQRFLDIGVRSFGEGTDRAQALFDMIVNLRTGDIALLHIRQQNAGLLLTARKDGLLFEAFELLAPNQDVMSCTGALLREFPDRAALVPPNTVHDHEFLSVLTDFFQKVETGIAPITRPKTMKAGREQPEDRDTISPVLVTGMLIDIFAGLGEEVKPERFTKRSREQVGWNQTFHPFHRSPTWLLLRVAVRAVLDRHTTPSGQNSLYKQLMAYHHGEILDIAMPTTPSSGMQATPHIASDTLFSMNAKLARRIVKLDLSEEIPSLDETIRKLSHRRRLLDKRWEKVQKEDTSVLPFGKLSNLSFHQDAKLELKRLKEHLAWIRSRPTGTRDPMGPGDPTRFDSVNHTEIPHLHYHGTQNIIMDWPHLLQVEAWTEKTLPRWLLEQSRLTNSISDAEGQLEKLGNLMDAYCKQACEAYIGVPGALSLMYLVIMELWVATDKIAGKLIPLLLDYDPGFPPDLLHPLLLERSEDMRRLKDVECYLSRRRQEAGARTSRYTSAFGGFGDKDSFAVQYFRTSPKHQALHETIVDKASRMKDEKLEEYKSMKAKHQSLTAEFNQTDHQTFTNQWGRSRCTYYCSRCQLEVNINGLKIDAFEWPLPHKTSHAHAAVVEISLPQIVKIWRDGTWKLVTEVFRKAGKEESGSSQRLYFVEEHSGIGDIEKKTSRVRPASTVKPMECSHYMAYVRHISEATPENICVPHAARYDYYDEHSKLSTKERIGVACMPQHCSYAGIVKSLPVDKWVRCAGHTSNDVIAGQSDCPQNTKLEEFRAFGNLRSGVALQWANILCQLAIPSVDLNKPATFALMLQAFLEAGPDWKFLGDATSILRDAHTDTQNETFMAGILGAMDEALDRVRESWQNYNALALLTCLCTRLLALSPSVDMSNHFLSYLAQVRIVSMDWMTALSEKLDANNVDREREEWTQRLLATALICTATFNVGKQHLESVLEARNELAVFVKSVVLVRNYLPPSSGRPSDPIALQLVHRWYAAMYQARDIVMDQAVYKDNQGLDDSIKSIWTDYVPPSSTWMQQEPDAQKHILERSDHRLTATFNLLTGNLFINGYPLSKLPEAYKTHLTFCEVFGDLVLDVGPSSDPEMEFSACHDLEGWVVHFKMTENKLVVRSVRERPDHPSEVWEYIPKGHLQGDLPNSFVNNYAHWLSLSANELEFRPIQQKWATSSENWRLALEVDSHILRKGSRFVIDLSSPTAKLVHETLRSFETRLDIDAILDSDSNSLGIELPRLSLSFSLQQGASIIKSDNYTGMEIDDQQAIGTLVGLSDRLVLRPSRGQGFRTVLVPRGQLSSGYTEASNHVKVSVRRTDESYVHHDAFIVDDKLGRLADTGSLPSKLYLSWLHALTSHCLPDPLTGRTGTEESLRMLEGAAMKSYPKLDHESRTILSQIAKLSPHRQYYPDHLQVMEQTTWNDDMPALSQHDSFWSLARSIYQGYKRSEELFQMISDEEHGKSVAKVFESPMSPTLEHRAKVRNAIFRVSGFGAEAHSTAHDEWYRPSNRPENGVACNRAYVAQFARCVDTGGQGLVINPCGNLADNIVAVNGQNFKGTPTVDLAFDFQLLDRPSNFLKGLFCGLHRALVAEGNKYKKILFLSTLLYAQKSNADIVQMLMALGNISIFSQADMLPPSDPEFDLTVTRSSLGVTLKEIVQNALKNRDECPESRWTRSSTETSGQFEHRQVQSWRSSSKQMVAGFADELAAQVRSSWIVIVPTGKDYQSYLEVGQIMPKVKSKVEMARRSDVFHTYLRSVCTQVQQVGIRHSWNLTLERDLTTIRPTSRPGFVSAISIAKTSPSVRSTELSLFAQPAPAVDLPRPKFFPLLCSKVRESGEENTSLSMLVDELAAADGLQTYQSSYLAELRRSIASPGILKLVMDVQRDDPKVQLTLVENLEAASDQYTNTYRRLSDALVGTSVAHQTLHSAGLYPRISPWFLLQCLSRRLWSNLSDDWRKSIVSLALSLIYLQRAERLNNHGLNLPVRWNDLQRELSNHGDHDSPDWNPLECPDNLLLEIEQGIMIRPIQNEIAAVMRSPPDGQNAVMQLNMGEGKSSVIVPVVAAALADGSRLVRAVVAKPQSNQMTHMLISRLGGLMDRPVFYLPISRSIRLSSDDVTTLRGMLDACQKEGGVLLVQPEQLLSFKLMGIDKSWGRENEPREEIRLGKDIIHLYQHFESVSRDIVDESDENFSVKFELIYTMGTQEPVEMSPDRWMLIQQILNMAEIAARELLKQVEKADGVAEGLLFEDYGPGRVPVIRVLDESMGRQLIEAVATEVCNNGLTGFPIHHQTKEMRLAILNYILRGDVDQGDVDMVENNDIGLFSQGNTKKVVLLLRGLLAKGVILFALGQKRFRVNYGLAPDRRPPTMLAVPYRAKDMPSPRSEFSHPDVVIVLTSLSYYYKGLSDAELYTCLELLGKSDQGDEEYGRWAVESPDLPESFRHLSSINLKDRPQCEGNVFPTLRYSRPVIDFYLATVVFPKEMKQFPLKLSASGWDLAKSKAQPLTGFSGTNDSKSVLPLSVKALDLQPHTNAGVLVTILREENIVLELGSGNSSHVSALTEEILLGALDKSRPPMRVVLDVGAQIIESSNFQMAQKLLSSVPTRDANAVIFFNDQDELSVLTRNGIVNAFLTSPFVSHTDRCLVFLDHAHTRGTDLKLPDDYRAAVTLGPGVTKDTLVQACMRMRKLGHGQSITFIVSPEMQKRIRAVRNITNGRPLVVSDIVAWALWETWDEEERSMPLWGSQGIRHIRQETIWEDVNKSAAFFSSHARRYLELEAMSLEERYRPKASIGLEDTNVVTLMSQLRIDDLPSRDEMSPHLDYQLSQIKKKLSSFANSRCGSNSGSSMLQEEQERELAPEIEQERQVSRPAPRNALKHKMHHDLSEFVRTGHVPANSECFLPAFAAMTKTSPASLYPTGVSSFPVDLLVTKDFVHTVDEDGPNYRSDSYQREVQWILVTDPSTSPDNTTITRMVIISPFEANSLKGVIENQHHPLPVTLRAYLPRPSLTFRSMEDLDTYIVPDHTTKSGPGTIRQPPPQKLIMQLNLFAGQAYLRSYEEYVRLCRYLGMMYTACNDNEASDGGGDVRTIDGFVGKRGYPDECGFDSNPVPFLSEMYKTIRRDYVGGFEKTHMGKIFAGEILREKDFDV